MSQKSNKCKDPTSFISFLSLTVVPRDRSLLFHPSSGIQSCICHPIPSEIKAPLEGLEAQTFQYCLCSKVSKHFKVQKYHPSNFYHFFSFIQSVTEIFPFLFLLFRGQSSTLSPRMLWQDHTSL